MKKFFLVRRSFSVVALPLAFTAFLFSCSNNSDQKPSGDTAKKDSLAIRWFGDTIDEAGAVPATEIASRIKGHDSIAIKLSGKIADVCQKKGCWMTIDAGNNTTMRVTFRDYGFFVPKDCGGMTAIVDGYAHVDTTSVADLREFAKDGGASEDSLKKITQPEVELSFEARGVIIKK